MTSASARTMRVLIVDDSAVAREILTRALARNGTVEVATAPNGSVAFEKIRLRRPDVIVLDLEMPGMRGLEFLERLMSNEPIPVVVCSGAAEPGAVAAVRALELGAVEVIQKPTDGLRAFLENGGREFAKLVRVAAGARLRPLARRAAAQHRPQTPPFLPHSGRSSCEIVVLGASTGGTEALKYVLSAMPADTPPTIIVQHMPGAFTAAFAARLDASCAMRVREATDGEPLESGLALVAPGGLHVEVQRVRHQLLARVRSGPTVSGHRPSVDVLFTSAARVIGAKTSAALLTGMGSDGAEGMLRLREAGAHTIAQDEESCVVFGMPRAAISLGAASEILPLSQIPAALHQRR